MQSPYTITICKAQSHLKLLISSYREASDIFYSRKFIVSNVISDLTHLTLKRQQFEKF